MKDKSYESYIGKSERPPWLSSFGRELRPLNFAEPAPMSCSEPPWAGMSGLSDLPMYENEEMKTTSSARSLRKQ
jgi:hypothetical protein